MNEATARAVEPGRVQRLFPALGAALGLFVGLFDFGFFYLVGVEMRLGSTDVTAFISVFFTVNFALFGYVIGRLALTRLRLRHSASVIAAQMDALERSRLRSLQSEKLATVGRLAAGVAHEVRNPLGVIRSAAAMLTDEEEQESEAYRAREFICEEVDRLNSFVTALLDYSKPVASHKAPSEMREVAEAALQRAAAECEKRGIALSVAGEQSLVALVDPDLLIQVILGLILNAAQAIGEDGKIKVVLSTSGERCFIDVADDGPGIAAESMSRIFDPFFTTKAEGTGLGLAMAARIAEGHEGTVELVERAGLGPAGRGACLRLNLPLGVSARELVG